MSIETKINYKCTAGFSANAAMAFDGTKMSILGTNTDIALLGATSTFATTQTGTDLASNTIDGDADTFWLSGTLAGTESITINVANAYGVSSFVITTDATDKITDYELFGSQDNISYVSIFSEAANTDEEITIGLSTPYIFYRLDVTGVSDTEVKIYTIEINGTTYNTGDTNFVLPQLLKADELSSFVEESNRSTIASKLTGGSGPYRIASDTDQFLLKVKSATTTISLTQSVKVVNTVSTVLGATYPTLTGANNAFDFTIDEINYPGVLVADYSSTPPTLANLISEINTIANTVQTGLTIPLFDIAFDNGSGFLELRGRDLTVLPIANTSEVNVNAAANDFYTEIGFTVASTSGTDVALATIVTEINDSVQAIIEIGKVIAADVAGVLTLSDTDNNGYIALVDVANDAYTNLGFSVSAPDANDEVASSATAFDATKDDIKYFAIVGNTGYFYSTVASDWVVATVRSYLQASTLSDINDNIDTLPIVTNSFVQIVAVLKSTTGVTTPELISNTLGYGDNQSSLAFPNKVEVNVFILDPITTQPKEDVVVRVGLVRSNVTNGGFILNKTFVEVKSNSDGLAQFFLTETANAVPKDAKYIVTIPSTGTRKKFSVPDGPPINIFS